MAGAVTVARALLGARFDGERFDRIVFYEAFHHAIDCPSLLRGLHDRLNPGGRVLLCGEPVMPDVFEGVTYPWGPRLDARSVFCMRRSGWMELGFTHRFFLEPGSAAGEPEPEPLPSVPTKPNESGAAPAHLPAWLDVMQASTSWRVTRPLRLAGRLLGHGWGGSTP